MATVSIAIVLPLSVSYWNLQDSIQIWGPLKANKRKIHFQPLGIKGFIWLPGLGWKLHLLLIKWHYFFFNACGRTQQIEFTKNTWWLIMYSYLPSQWLWSMSQFYPVKCYIDMLRNPYSVFEDCHLIIQQSNLQFISTMKVYQLFNS